jgi:hypothetical protein
LTDVLDILVLFHQPVHSIAVREKYRIETVPHHSKETGVTQLQDLKSAGRQTPKSCVHETSITYNIVVIKVCLILK